MTGLRGVGKTALLNEIERLAHEQAYQTIHIEAHEERRLSAMIAPHLRGLLYSLDRMAGIGDRLRRRDSGAQKLRRHDQSDLW